MSVKTGDLIRDCILHATESKSGVYSPHAMEFSTKSVWLSFSVAATVGAALFFLFSPPPPSYAVAVLGAVAVVITLVLPKEPSKGEKAVWIIIASLLMVIEMVAVNHSQEQQDSHFSSIESGLTTAVQESKETLKEAEATLKTTEQIGSQGQIQHDDLIREDEALRAELGETAYETLYLRNQRIRTDLDNLSALVNRRWADNQRILVQIDSTFRLEYPGRPDLEARARTERQNLDNTAWQGFQKQYLIEIQPPMIKVLREILTASGKQAEPDDNKLANSFLIGNASQVLVQIARIKAMAAELRP
ncbi:MAG: hypothetical protein ABSA32_04435 [Candidatus Acidiferrales bacterium]